MATGMAKKPNSSRGFCGSLFVIIGKYFIISPDIIKEMILFELNLSGEQDYVWDPAHIPTK